jgi:ATP-dependent RNA helicase DeaD
VDAAPVIARGHNVAVFLPPVPEALLPYVQAIPATPTLVLAADADRAAAIAEHVPDAFAVSGLARAQARLAAARPAVVCAGVLDAVALLERSALHPSAYRTIVLAWPEHLDADGRQALGTVMGECDREAQRIVCTAEPATVQEPVLDRYAFKAMTYGFPPVEPPEGWAPPAPVGPARIVLGAPAQFALLRRRVLDSLNPERDEDVVIAPCPASREAAEALAARSGATGPVVVALPWQLPWLRTVFSPCKALPLPTASEGAARRADTLRARLVQLVESEDLDRERLLLAPLLERHDPADLAAAALWLAARRPAATTPAAAPLPGTAGAAFTRVWIGIGRKDGVRPGDLVAALANEAKVPADAVGKLDIRELFTLAEVRPDQADTAARGLTGVTVRGRRIVARVDRGPSHGGDHGGGPRGERPPRRR